MKVLTSRQLLMASMMSRRVGAQHAALVGHLDAGDALAQPVHGAARPSGGTRLSWRLRRIAADVVVALVHLGEQLADFLGRVLQVGVQRDDDARRGSARSRP